MKVVLLSLVSFMFLSQAFATHSAVGGIQQNSNAFKEKTGILAHPAALQSAAQTGHKHPSPIPHDVPILLVDGAITPEQIPDDVAYSHFIRAAAISSKPTRAEVSRRDGFLALVGLTADDRRALVTSLAGVGDQLNRIARQKQQLAPDSLLSVQGLAPLVKLRAEEEAVLASARARLDLSLSFVGYEQLDRHIQHRIKSRIKVYVPKP